ncbi:hypothetical protein TNCV_1193081 [Trichonephila clavipes]|nr:hypothetical protein TNCV_1193081 [Trichonephila clavipes]
MKLEKRPHRYDFERKSCVVCLLTLQFLSELSESTPMVIKKGYVTGETNRDNTTQNMLATGYTVVSDTDCGAVGAGFESRVRHGRLCCNPSLCDVVLCDARDYKCSR